MDKGQKHTNPLTTLLEVLCAQEDDRIWERCLQLGRDLKIAIITILNSKNGIREKATDAFRVISSYNESTTYLDVLKVQGYLSGNWQGIHPVTSLRESMNARDGGE